MNDNIAMSDKQHYSCLQVSVHVLIYNGSWERVRATLNSVIMQKGIDFELIIMDDCSDINHSDRIKDFLSRHDFTNYRLIVHEKNLGTVATCLEAAELSRAEYVRGLGQGDMFFDEYALRDSYNYMVKTDAEVMISKAVWYQAFSNPIEIIEHYRYPQNIKAYDDPDELRESYLIHDDSVSGATVMYKRDIFIEYMTEAVTEGMKYIEDFMIKSMVFDKRRINFFDRNVIFYEFGAGISTVNQKDTPYRTKEIYRGMMNDIYSIYVMLVKRCEAHHSEFSERLASLAIPKIKAIQRWEDRQKLKAKLGIAAIPLVLANKIFIWIKEKINPQKEEKNIKYIMTDVNVSTDFANLCINRE